MEDWEAIRLNFVICKNSRRAHYLLLEFNSTIAKLKCNAPSLIEISETAFFTETNLKTEALAELELGQSAQNIAGARLLAERIASS